MALFRRAKITHKYINSMDIHGTGSDVATYFEMKVKGDGDTKRQIAEAIHIPAQPQ